MYWQEQKIETRNYTCGCVQTHLCAWDLDKMTTLSLSWGRRSVLPLLRQKATICGPNSRSFPPFAPQMVTIVSHSTQKPAVIFRRNASISGRKASIFGRNAPIFGRKSSIPERKASISERKASIFGRNGVISQPVCQATQISGPFPPISRFLPYF